MTSPSAFPVPSHDTDDGDEHGPHALLPVQLCFELDEPDVAPPEFLFGGIPLSSLRAFALDPEVELRCAVARDPHNWDVGLQRVLATDPDERVVLTLLGQVDPAVEVTRLVIAGPHVEARRILAGRNLTTPSLLLLAEDDDAIARQRARATLTARGVPVPDPAPEVVRETVGAGR
jgi:hypothetical protein